ncbi:hypothetical protein GUJ93_ZPchr0011g28064 [Zizania palustris]|uniref:Uncharacterized protein n=1 Tax=Zizania palustris TaxID=103762 RepID=A0A8J5WGE8_ZIZPA|nr:hypothetical protein GUJ93_ZPchr0011g28064 [Zizania palustris]
MALNFVLHWVQPLKQRIYPAFEYSGLGDLTRERVETMGVQRQRRECGDGVFTSKLEIKDNACPHPFRLSTP